MNDTENDPFANMTDEELQEYWEDSVADEWIEYYKAHPEEC